MKPLFPISQSRWDEIDLAYLRARLAREARRREAEAAAALSPVRPFGPWVSQ